MTGWWTEGVDDPALINQVIDGSHCFAIATIGEQIVGIGRAISDGISDAYIQDITVNESFRRKGIASQIVEKIVEKLHEDGLYWIGLIAERGSQEFYLRLGFKPMENATPMLRKDI
jgi:spermidine synthase